MWLIEIIFWKVPNFKSCDKLVNRDGDPWQTGNTTTKVFYGEIFSELKLWLLFVIACNVV